MDVFTTSYLRSNIIAWLPVKKEDSVLLIENGVPAIEKKVREMTEQVTTVLPKDVWKIKEKFNYIFCLGNILEVCSQDIVTSADFTGRRSDRAKAAVIFLKGLLRDKGKLVLAVENKLGLKYLAGAREEATHTYYAGLEKNSGICGFSRKELETLILDTDSRGRFYYPFPDYRFAMSIYSDEYQPKTGELVDQIGNFDDERLLMFDESMAMDTLVEEGLFPQFSNSYLLVIGTKEPVLKNREQEEILFVKFSNDRGESHNIKTFITKSKDGERHLVKTADGAAAHAHVMTFGKAERELSGLFSGSMFLVNAHQKREDGAEFEFLSGHSLEEEADLMLEAGQEEEACGLILHVAEEIRKCQNLKPFASSPGFEEVFGKVEVPRELMAPPFCDIDMILPNIILTGDKKTWTVIDYEWSFDFPVPIGFVVFRMLHYYVETTAKRRNLKKYHLYEKAGLTGKELEVYPLMEEAFQKYILKGHIPLRELFLTEGKPRYHRERVLRGLNEIREIERRQALTVYFDRGSGFSEEDVRSFKCEALDGVYQMEIEIPSDVQKLRVDPGNEAVTVDIRKLCWKGEPQGVVSFLTNGHKMEENQYLFDTRDPNLLLESLPRGDRTLVIDLKVETMSLEAAEWIAPKIDARYRWKKMMRR